MGLLFGNKFGRKNPPSSLYEHKAYVLNRSNILDIANKIIVLYRIEFMPVIHSPS
jgi:hypothetical protein